MTKYVVVTVGDAITEEPVLADKVVAGVQLYVMPPEAERVVVVFWHIVVPEPALIVGSELTDTVTVAVFVHPFDPVPVTV